MPYGLKFGRLRGLTRLPGVRTQDQSPSRSFSTMSIAPSLKGPGSRNAKVEYSYPSPEAQSRQSRSGSRRVTLLGGRSSRAPCTFWERRETSDATNFARPTPSTSSPYIPLLHRNSRFCDRAQDPGEVAARSLADEEWPSVQAEMRQLAFFPCWGRGSPSPLVHAEIYGAVMGVRLSDALDVHVMRERLRDGLWS